MTRRPRKKARIEIIPLIDIMFFLLACFMMVSLTMATTKSIKVNLPTAQSADPDRHPNTLVVSVDAAGGIYLDKRPVGRNEFGTELARLRGLDPALRVVITGDTDARHGALLGVLDRVRLTGIQNVAFETREAAPTTAQ
jgi:biopolymer transport protein ExbD